MDKTYRYFAELHRQAAPLLIGNVWNAQSAKIFEKLNFKAVATSSAAVAETLGYPDGEEMSFEEYLFIIKRIVNAVKIPVSVDLEAGYGDTVDVIVDNIRQLHQLGIAGINIEDSVVSGNTRSLMGTDAFAGKISEITKSLTADGIDMFINLRSDVFLLNHPGGREEATRRIKAYENTGVHGLFFPCIKGKEDIAAIVQATALPVNVMCIPGLPGFADLRELGVKRISMGNFLNSDSYRRLEIVTESILKSGSFDVVFSA